MTHRMRIRRVVLALAAATMMSAGCTPAVNRSGGDGPASRYAVEAGDDVRVRTFHGRGQSGRVVAIDSTRLVIRSDSTGTGAPVDLASIRSIERRVGPASLAGAGALFGAVSGLLLGAHIVGQDARHDGDATDFSPAIYGPVIGAAVGVLVGRLIRFDRWERVHPGPAGVEMSADRVGIVWRF